MIITDDPSGLTKGSVVNFSPVAGVVKIELSIPNATAQGIQVGATLKQLAYKVEE